MLDLLPVFYLASKEYSSAGVQGGLAFKPPTFTLEPGRPTDPGLGSPLSMCIIFDCGRV